MADIIKAVENQLRRIKRDYTEIRKLKLSDEDRESMLKHQLENLAVIGQAIKEITETIREYKINRTEMEQSK